MDRITFVYTNVQYRLYIYSQYIGYIYIVCISVATVGNTQELSKS